MSTELQPGQVLARGMCRGLRAHDFLGLLEFVPTRGLRVDVLAVGPKGEIWIIECKSSRADFISDNKWMGYLDWCDEFFWCVGPDFPLDLLPEETGIMIADGYDGEIVRRGPVSLLAPARRKVITQKALRTSMARLGQFVDPRPGVRFAPDPD